MIRAIAKWFSKFWGKIRSFFKKLWAILTDPFGWFMSMFAKIVGKITGNVGKSANKAIWSYASPKNRSWYMKHSSKIFIGIAILIGAAAFGINYGINYFVNKDLCIDPKTGEVLEDDLNNPIKLKDTDCPYDIPEGMCQDPETLAIFKNDYGEIVRSDSPACPSSTFDQDAGMPDDKLVEGITTPEAIPAVPMVDILEAVQAVPVQTQQVQQANTTTQAVSDFREKLRNKTGGRRKRIKVKRNARNNPEYLIKTYKKYLNLHN
jgi:hypothetical protein